jgi:Glycosyl hydrolase family 26
MSRRKNGWALRLYMSKRPVTSARFPALVACSFAFALSACSGSDGGSGDDANTTGGMTASGGAVTSGGHAGTPGSAAGATSSSAGASAGGTGGAQGGGGQAVAGAATGGASNGGGGGGGAATSGASNGGAAMGGANHGGAGGSSPTGGASNGGANNGGAAVGGTSHGGAAMGGASHGGGGSGGAATGGANSGGAAGSGGNTGSGCNVSPVDPNATQQAKNLLCYLYSIYGKKVLSGQQETSWSNPANDISYYTGNSSIGKAPAILGGDFLYGGTGTASQGTTTSRAQAYWAAGGLTMIRYHMGAPPNSDSYANSMLGFTSTQCVNVITSGTTENTSYVSKLNGIAANLQTLQTAGVPVILALFHETQQGGWFWWSKCSNTQFIALYKYTYNYLVNTKGIHNIIRLMPYSGSPTASYYPGKDFVDVTGGDTYGTNVPFTGLYGTMRGIGGTTIPLALHETGVVPQPSTMFPTAAPWLLWNVWAGYETSNNTVATMASAYSSQYTITRDEIPNLK